MSLQVSKSHAPIPPIISLTVASKNLYPEPQSLSTHRDWPSPRPRVPSTLRLPRIFPRWGRPGWPFLLGFWPSLGAWNSRRRTGTTGAQKASKLPPLPASIWSLAPPSVDMSGEDGRQNYFCKVLCSLVWSLQEHETSMGQVDGGRPDAATGMPFS